MFERFKRDLGRYFALDSADGHPTLREKVRIVFDAPQLQAIAAYRFGSWVNRNVRSKVAKVPLKIAYHAMDKAAHALWGIHIDEGADIGGGLYIGHPGDVLIGPVKMGEDCNITNQVILGRRSDGRGKGGTPTIGDRVWIGTGSMLFGDIEVGSGATIGPLTVVGRNVAPHSLVMGNPMQVLRRDWDNSHQIYGTGDVREAPLSSMKPAAQRRPTEPPPGPGDAGKSA